MRKLSLTPSGKRPSDELSKSKRSTLGESLMEGLKRKTIAFDTLLSPRLRGSSKHESGAKQQPEQRRLSRQAVVLDPKSISDVQSMIDRLVHTSVEDLERSEFIYAGKPNKNGVAVIYWIAHRLPHSALAYHDIIYTHVMNTIKRFLDKPFIFVFDLSWIKLTSEQQAAYAKLLGELMRLARPSHIENLERIILLQATNRVAESIERLLEKHFPKKKIDMVFEWPDLSPTIPEVELPALSRGYLIENRTVTKTKGISEEEQRIIKLGTDCIYELDPSTSKILQQIPFANISDVTINKDGFMLTWWSTTSAATADGNTTTTTTTTEPGSSNDASSSSSSSSSSFNESTGDEHPAGDGANADSPSQTEIYFCEHPGAIAYDIFDAVIAYNDLSLPRRYHVSNVLDNAQIKSFTLSLGAESILCFAADTLAHEISYVRIESFYLSEGHKNLIINFLQGGEVVMWVLEVEPSAEVLRKALGDAIERSRVCVDLAIEFHNDEGACDVMQTFYSKINDGKVVMGSDSLMLNPNKAIESLKETFASIYVLAPDAQGSGSGGSISTRRRSRGADYGDGEVVVTPSVVEVAIPTSVIKEHMLIEYGLGYWETADVCKRLDRQAQDKIRFIDFVQGWLYFKNNILMEV